MVQNMEKNYCTATHEITSSLLERMSKFGESRYYIKTPSFPSNNIDVNEAYGS